MKELIIILQIFNVSIISAQNTEKYFQFSDTIFQVGQIKNIEIGYYLSGGGQPIKESIPMLDSIVDFLKNNENIRIEIGTHTDYRRDYDLNISLTEIRTEKVCKYLISIGINSGRVKCVGYGESEPAIVDGLLNKKFSFLTVGTILDKDFCENQSDNEKKEIVCRINRRTSLKIISINSNN